MPCMILRIFMSGLSNLAGLEKCQDIWKWGAVYIDYDINLIYYCSVKIIKERQLWREE